MTDLELIKKCADRMGYNCYTKTYPATEFLQSYQNIEFPTGQEYNPLYDDAQAMELVKKVELDILKHEDKWQVGKSYTFDKPEIDSNLNLAICQCVAKLEK